MKCFRTDCTVQSPLFRCNEKGVAAVWGCAEHCPKPIDPQVKDIAEIVSNARPETRPRAADA